MIMPGVLGQWEEGKHECKGQIVKGFGRKMNDSQFHSAVSRKPFHFYLFFFVVVLSYNQSLVTFSHNGSHRPM